MKKYTLTFFYLKFHNSVSFQLSKKIKGNSMIPGSLDKFFDRFQAKIIFHVNQIIKMTDLKWIQWRVDNHSIRKNAKK